VPTRGHNAAIHVPRNESIPPPSPGYNTFTLTSITPNITRVLINNPPIQLLDANMIDDFNTLFSGITEDPDNSPSVIVFSSADPIFMISHIDLHILSKTQPLQPPLNSTVVLEKLINVTRSLATVPAILIAEIAGKATAGGNELLVQMDMRFASPGASLGVAEVAFGLLQGSGGMQYIARDIGLGRATEYALTADYVTDQTLADIGWVNQYFESKSDMESHVALAATKIGLWPRQAVVAIKESIREGSAPTLQSIEDDVKRFEELIQGPAPEIAFLRYLELSANQSRNAFEIDGDLTLLWP